SSDEKVVWSGLAKVCPVERIPNNSIHFEEIRVFPLIFLLSVNRKFGFHSCL
ncbi:hypothetical protein D021_0128B, partial [Vibrio parahaemolyticus 10296]